MGRKIRNVEIPEILIVNGLSNRTRYCLARNKIFTIKDLVIFLKNTNRHKSPLLKFKGCGVKISNEAYDFLINNGYIVER